MTQLSPNGCCSGCGRVLLWAAGRLVFANPHCRGHGSATTTRRASAQGGELA